ncbi:MAG: phosphopentomutase [Clostridiales bacterium]|nr:phosphopentomutase [Pygmaiobacter sp.]MDK2813485.1 phosphopentomutase [Clostridiales bacterium]
MAKRAFIIVLDSFGIGKAPDAAAFGDEGSDTLASISKSTKFNTPVLGSLGMFNIDDVTCCPPVAAPKASFARLVEQSKGKDTTIGHWEIAGVESANPLPTYPNGFPKEVIDEFEAKTGCGVLCNLPYSGTQVLTDYGEEHLSTGKLIVYTSADSVFQIAAHEDLVPVKKLYEYCEIARNILVGKHGVGRVIARPFVGTDKTNFKRTPNRHDFSLLPPSKTMLDYLQQAGLETIGVGKIYDIFAGQGVNKTTRTTSNHHGMEVTLGHVKEDFEGLCFVNLVDFDMLYGHRNDVDGYAAAATEFDGQLAEFLPLMRDEDILIITADHGCDPATPSTDHSRECVPMLIYGKQIREGINLGTRPSYANIAATVLDYFGVKAPVAGKSFLPEVLK